MDIGHGPSLQPDAPALLASLGFGATLGNGRWHTRGPIQVVYAASSRALCQLERRVHCSGAHSRNQARMRLDLPDPVVILDVVDLGLPEHWRDHEAKTPALGMAWAASGASLGLWVPSFIEPSERNVVLNPAHSDDWRITLTEERQPVRFDPRLFGRESSGPTESGSTWGAQAPLRRAARHG